MSRFLVNFASIARTLNGIRLNFIRHHVGNAYSYSVPAYMVETAGFLLFDPLLHHGDRSCVE